MFSLSIPPPIPQVADTCKSVPLRAVLFHSEIKSRECPADVTVRIQENKHTGTPQKCHRIMDSNWQHNDYWPSRFIDLTWVCVRLSMVVSKISNFQGGIQMIAFHDSLSMDISISLSPWSSFVHVPHICTCTQNRAFAYPSNSIKPSLW